MLMERNHDWEAQSRRPRPRRGLMWLGLLAVIVAVGAGAYGIVDRQRQTQAVAQWTDAQAVPTVDIIAPKRGVAGLEEVLPGTIRAWYEAPIFARVNGYLKNWYFDFGAHVKKGDVLAEIDTPDLDQQFHQAQADLAVAQANEKLAAITAKRWQALVKSDSVSQQETDEKAGALEAREADVNAAKANVQRLQALEDFKRLVAPFDGVVTARETDIGALINAGSSGNGPELFRVADVHAVRVFVEVPQQMSADIHPGQTADLRIPQFPGKVFKAEVATTAQSISQASRTLLVELHADNPDGVLEPGTYVQVHFDLPADPDMVHIPTSALLFREHGLQVAVLGPGDKVELKSVTVGRNLGTDVEILAGLSPSDRVINSPPDSLSAGDLVRVAESSAQTTADAEDNAHKGSGK